MTNHSTTPPIRLLLVDVDGTMIGADLQVTPRVRESLAQARAKGVQIALCTGRPEIGTRQYIEALQLDGYHIMDAGATIADPLAGKTLFRQGISPETALALVDYANQHDLYLEIYGSTGYYSARQTEHTRIHAMLQKRHPVIADLRQIATTLSIVKMECVTLDDAEAARVQTMLDLFADQVDYGWATAPGIAALFVNILARGISKGSAVRRLIEHTGIPVGQVMGIGDGPNDEPMLREVGVSVAMGDSPVELKQLATWVTSDVNEDGLALAIDKFILHKNGVNS